MKFFINVIFKRNILNNISNNLFCFKLNVWLYTSKRTCLRITNHTSTIISPELSDTERIFAHDWSHEFWTQDENSTQKTIKTNEACSKFSRPHSFWKGPSNVHGRLSQTAFQTGLEQRSINLPEPGEAKHKINPTSILLLCRVLVVGSRSSPPHSYLCGGKWWHSLSTGGVAFTRCRHGYDTLPSYLIDWPNLC